MAEVSPTWDFKKLAKLYIAVVTENIFKRACKMVFENAQDDDLKEYKFRRHDEEPFIFKFDKFNWYVPTKHDLCLIIENHSKDPFINGIRNTNELALVTSIMEKAHELNKVKIYKIILEPLLAQHTTELFMLYSGFVYKYQEYKFNPDIPLDREISLRSRDDVTVKIHKHVAVSTGKYLPKIILSVDFKPAEEMTLNASGDTLKWFVEQAYTGEFVFNDELDNIDALNLLDFLLIETKATLLDLFVKTITK
jgi:hypothetical protein